MTPLQSQLGKPSQPSQPSAPTGDKPRKGLAQPVPGFKPAQMATPSNLRSALTGVEANAEQEFLSNLEKSPMRQKFMARRNQGIADMQGIQQRMAAPQPAATLTDAIVGFGDRRTNRELNGTGVLGNQRGRQFNTGSTPFAGGQLAEALDVPQRQSSFSAERRDAAIAAIKDGTFRDRAIVDTRPTFATADDADRFAAYQDRRQDRRENALAMRQQIGQQREAARQQAMVAQAEAAQNPMNSPMFQQLMMSRPEAAVDFASAVIDANTRRLLGLGEWNNRARLAEADAGIERERLKDGRDRVATDAEIRRESLRSREAIAEGDRAQRSITARESNQSREQLSRDRMSFDSRGVEARAARDEAAAKALEAENTPEAQRRAVVFEIWDRLSKAGYVDPKLKEQVFGELVDGLNQ